MDTNYYELHEWGRKSSYSSSFVQFVDSFLKKKRPVFTGPCPLRHAEHIVIWEGNYMSDMIIIGKKERDL